MSLKTKPFHCEKCCNQQQFTWKTHHGKKTKIITQEGDLILNQLQIKCKNCGHKFYLTRKLLGLAPMQRIPTKLIRKFALAAALATYRSSKKIINMFSCKISKSTIWRSVQKVGSQIDFTLDINEMAEGFADGTGILIQNIKHRGRELKVFAQKKYSGGIRIAGLSIGKYHGEWEKIFDPLQESFKQFGKKFFLVTDGDDAILKGLKGKVDLIYQRCLWHIAHQLKYTLWKDDVKRKSDDWVHILGKSIDITLTSTKLSTGVKKVYEEDDIIEDIIKAKLEKLEELINFCYKKDYRSSWKFLENAKKDMFTALQEGLQGSTTSLVERVMRTVNLRANVGKWSDDGALNAMKIRLAYYYNGWDV
jgi:hypothetical protein